MDYSKTSAAVLLWTAALLAGCNDSGSSASGSAGGTISAPPFRPYMPTPDADSFYAQPNPMAHVPPGTILNSREVQFAPLGIPLPNPAWQLQYMSRDMRGNPQAAIATVVQPLVPAATGNKPLVSLQFAENS